MFLTVFPTPAAKLVGWLSAGLALAGIPVTAMLDNLPAQSIVTAAVALMTGVSVALLKTRPATIQAETARDNAVAQRLAESTQVMFDRQEATHIDAANFLKEQIAFFKGLALDAKKLEMIQTKARHDVAGDRSSLILYIRLLEEMVKDGGGTPPGIHIPTMKELLGDLDAQAAGVMDNRIATTTEMAIAAATATATPTPVFSHA